jgi:hypothetical protein
MKAEVGDILIDTGDPTLFSRLLTYGSSDPAPYPNLVRHLTFHSDENGYCTPIPFRCQKFT